MARDRGFRSRAEERRYSRHIRNRSDLDQLPEAAQGQRMLALKTVSFMRESPGLGLTDAASMAGTNPEAVVWHAGEALHHERGSWRPTSGDRLYRAMWVHSNGETVTIDVRGSHKASEVGAYHAAVRYFVETGDETALLPFSGKTVAGIPYETELSVLEEMGRRGQLNFDSIYQLVS